MPTPGLNHTYIEMCLWTSDLHHRRHTDVHVFLATHVDGRSLVRHRSTSYISLPQQPRTVQLT